MIGGLPNMDTRCFCHVQICKGHLFKVVTKSLFHDPFDILISTKHLGAPNVTWPLTAQSTVQIKGFASWLSAIKSLYLQNVWLTSLLWQPNQLAHVDCVTVDLKNPKKKGLE